MKYQPMQHQQIAIDFCLKHPRAGLLMGMGLGKTSVSLSVFMEYKDNLFTARRALVIAPKNVAQNVWAQECLKWDHTKDLRCSIILGTEKQRKAALETDADLYIINRENVVWLMEELHGSLKRFDMVILDELSSFKSTSAKRWKALKKPIQSVRYVLGLTGTPAPNGYLDLWPQMFLLDGGECLGKRIGDYRARYFTMGAHKGHIVYEWRLRIGAQDAINRKLRELCISMSSEDWLKLPPVIYNTVYVSMDKAGKKSYDKFQKDKVIPLLETRSGIRQLDPNNEKDLEKMTSAIQADTAAVVTGKLLQMANGAVYDDNGTVVPIHDAKLDALEEIVEANDGNNLLVFYSYQHDLDRIITRFPKARVFSGPGDVDDWNAGRIPMLLCHPASCGHGLNLQQGGHIIVWFGLTWSLELYQQANARLPRPGQKESVIVMHLICRDTVEEKVLSALQEKDTSQGALLNALKGYLSGGSV